MAVPDEWRREANMNPGIPDSSIGEAVCNALRSQVSKLGLSIGDEPVWAEAAFEETTDRFRRRSA